MPGETYAQTGLPIKLSVIDHHSLSAGAKFQLRFQAKYKAPYVASQVPVKLHGGRATLQVTLTAAMENAAGSDVRSYEIAVVSRGRVLGTSRAVPVLWVPPPASVQVLEGSGENQTATTSTTTGAVTCSYGSPSANACVDGSVSPGEAFFGPQVVAGELPPKWAVILLFNGQTVCTDVTLQGSCSGMITVPAAAPLGQANPLTGELISPQGKATGATINITNTGR